MSPFNDWFRMQVQLGGLYRAVPRALRGLPRQPVTTHMNGEKPKDRAKDQYPTQESETVKLHNASANGNAFGLLLFIFIYHG